MTEPTAATTKQDGSRTYLIPTPNGELHLPSVTTILGIIDKPALKQWAANMAADYTLNNMEWIIERLGVNKRDEVRKAIAGAFRAKRDKAADKGSMAHATIERFLLGDEIAVEDQSPYFRAARDFISDHSLSLEAAEATVYNLSEGYAGTLDALMRTSDGVVGAVDWKTRQGKRVSQTWIYETEFLQVAAYCRAEFLLLPNGESVPMPEVAGGAVVALCEDGYRSERVDVDRDYAGFLHARGLFDWKAEWKEGQKK